MKNKSKKIILIISITILIVAVGITLPIIVKGDNDNARAGEVLSGKTFTNGSAVGIAGTMKNFSEQIPEVTAEAAGEDYIATIELDPGYYENIKINAKPIYDAGQSDITSNPNDYNLYTSTQYTTYGTQRYNAGYSAGKSATKSATIKIDPTSWSSSWVVYDLYVNNKKIGQYCIGYKESAGWGFVDYATHTISV